MIGGSSESTHVKMPHRWKSHVMAQVLTIMSYEDQDQTREVPIVDSYGNPCFSFWGKEIRDRNMMPILMDPIYFSCYCSIDISQTVSSKYQFYLQFYQSAATWGYVQPYH